MIEKFPAVIPEGVNVIVSYSAAVEFTKKGYVPTGKRRESKIIIAEMTTAIADDLMLGVLNEVIPPIIALRPPVYTNDMYYRPHVPDPSLPETADLLGTYTPAHMPMAEQTAMEKNLTGRLVLQDTSDTVNRVRIWKNGIPPHPYQEPEWRDIGQALRGFFAPPQKIQARLNAGGTLQFTNLTARILQVRLEWLRAWMGYDKPWEEPVVLKAPGLKTDYLGGP